MSSSVAAQLASRFRASCEGDAASAQDCLGTLPVADWKELRPVLTALNPPVDPVAALFDDLVEPAKPAGMELRDG